jgi:tRNA(Ile)-lysidine synthase
VGERNAWYLSRVSVQSEDASAGASGVLHRALEALPRGRYLLAISGGRDSMVLLEAMHRWHRDQIAAVATFDHGTGVAARRAAALVARTAEQRELPVVSGRSGAATPRTEAAWRTARWAFLRAWAEEFGARVVTAHTRDDQVETVVLRILRGSGARGLAGMSDGFAPTAGPTPVRPLLTLPRDALAAYARERGVQYVVDPSNADRLHQRNRVRHDLLPALEAATPGFRAWCLSLSERAAAVRALSERVVDGMAPSRNVDGTLVVRAAALEGLAGNEWRALWPALAARANVVMDRRGIERASEWAPHAAPGAEIPLAGGARIARTASTFVIRPAPPGTTLGSDDYILKE